MKSNELGIYIHIPFCVRKCQYCDFLSFPAGEADREAYVQALCREIRQWEMPAGEAVSVFFGGGTPSLLTAGQIGRILESVADRFALRDPEITLESNPGTLSRSALTDFRRMGINRLSIGLQSAHDDELAALGRIHNWKTFARSYEEALRAGFENINVDLMSGLPGQTLLKWEDTLLRTVNLEKPPAHISAYSLIIEEGTPFYETYHEADERRRAGEPGADPLPDEDTERAMYYLTRDLLRSRGYEQYEISNYATPGYRCRHNLGYWRRRDYIGFGLGAASCADGVRWRNTGSMKEYVAHAGRAGWDLREEITVLTREEKMEETVFLGLRMREGIDLAAFADEFGEDLRSVYGERIGKLEEQGLLCCDGQRVFVTDRGMDLEGYVEQQLLV